MSLQRVSICALALVLGVASGNLVAAQEAADNVVARFALADSTFAHPFTVDKVEAGGTLHAMPTAGRKPRTAMAEGYYFAFVWKDGVRGPGEGIAPGATLIRVQVTEIGPENALTMQVGPSLGDKVAAGTTLLVCRAADSTTAALKQFPELVVLEAAPAAPKRTANNAQPSINNLKQIGLALHNFHDAIGHFPPAAILGPDGRPWHSWRVLILPYLEQQKLYEQYKFDEPWDGPHNSKLLDKMPAVYSDPAHGKNQGYFTHYAAVVGPGLAFETPDAKIDPAKPQPLKAGGTSIRKFLDGTSNTAMVASVAPERKIAWMQPDDIVVGEQTTDAQLIEAIAWPYGDKETASGVFLFADAHVQTIPRTVDPKLLRPILTRAGKEIVDFTQLGGPAPPQQQNTGPAILLIRDGDTIKAVLSAGPTP